MTPEQQLKAAREAVEQARRERAKDKTPRGLPLAERTDHLDEDEERARADRPR